MGRGRQIAGGVLGLALFWLAPASAQAALLDATCPGLPDGGTNGGGRAQTYTAVRTGTLVRGEMFVAKSAGADFQMYILNAGPSGPTGDALGTTTIPDSSIPSDPTPSPTSDPEAVDGTFNPGVNVVAGQQYAIFLARGGSNFLSMDRGGAPCPGNEFSGTVGGSWLVVDQAYDLPFSTFVNPPNAFTLGKVKGKKVFLNLPGPGTVDVAGVGTGGLHPVKPSHVDIPAAGAIPVAIHLNKSGKSRLRRHGKLKVTPAFTYTPTGGEPNRIASKVTLKAKK
jgi:hypothetical protein